MRIASLFLVVAAAAQETGGMFPVSGMVVNSATSEPVPHAMVTATCFAPPKSGVGVRRISPATDVGRPLSAVSDQSGAFHFDAVPAGNCVFGAQKAGFEWTRGESLEVTTPVNTRLSMDPLGAISGKIVDEEGAPVYGATILLLTARMDDGLRVAHLDRTVRTDDRGVYRVWNLRPGKYYVKAAGRRASSNLYSADSGPIGLFAESFSPTYFGGGSEFASATAVVIDKGTQAQADLRVAWKPAFKVAGVIENAVPRQPVQFELSINGEEFTPSSVNIHGDTGRFEILDVLPGTYLLRARQQELWAERPLTVRGDVSGVTVSLAREIDVPVVQRVANPDAVPEIEMRGQKIRQQPYCSIALHRFGYPPSDSSIPPVLRCRGTGEGMKVEHVSPGRYRVRVECSDGYVQSAFWGAQDLLTNGVVSIQAGTLPPPIEILARAGGGSASFTLLANLQSRPAILVVPQFTPSTGPIVSAAGLQGRYSGLAPGPYVAYAIPDDTGIEYRNPEVLRALRGGVTFQVSDNQETKVTLSGVSQ